MKIIKFVAGIMFLASMALLWLQGFTVAVYSGNWSSADILVIVATCATMFATVRAL